jgi:hypothetical protein
VAELSEEELKTMKRAAFMEAIEIVQELGRNSKGQPLTPSFIVFKLKQHLNGQGVK